MERYCYQDLLSWKQQERRKPLILMGVRQSGKTYLLLQFGAAEFPRVHYINFEKEPKLAQLFASSLDPAHLINALSFYLDTPIDRDHDLLIFDEVQACPAALTSLKYFQEEMAELALCCAGSLLGVHLTPVSFPVGKVDIMPLHPMSFSEFLLALGDHKALDFLNQCGLETQIPTVIHEHLWERLKWYFIVGGLPEVVDEFQRSYGGTVSSRRMGRRSSQQPHYDLYAAFNRVRTKQEGLILSYYADVAKHSGKINALHIDRVWRSVPSQLARAQNGSASKFQFKGIVPGIDRYQRLAGAIDWLTAAGLAVRVPIVNHAELPLMAYAAENRFKMYLFDVGILGALSNLPPKVILGYNYGTYKGYFAENFVAQELTCAGHSLYSWQERRAEIEFLFVSDDGILPIEVKSGWVTKANSLGAFAKKYHPLYRTIMSAKNLRIDKKIGLYGYPLYLAFRFPMGS